MPLIRRLPKRGFNNAAFHKSYAIVNLSDLNEFKPGTIVNEQLLRESNLIRGDAGWVKILGDGELKHALTVEADTVSASAREKIDRAGGTFIVRDRRAARSAVADDNIEGAGQAGPAQTATATKTKKKSSTGSRATPKKKTSPKT